MKICVIGAAGYMGYPLCQTLESYELTRISTRQDQYLPDWVQSFDVIIYLGGISNMKMGYNDVSLNTNELYNIASMMLSSQLLIYASTSAISEDSDLATEETPVNVSKLEAYPLSMLARENLIKSLPVSSVGLRLGTVIGISKKQRSDRIHIQMLKSALFTGHIHVYHPLSQRPIISMTEFINSIHCILNSRPNIIGSKIYNLASFNTTVQAIASSIALLTNAKIIYHPSDKERKGFSVDCSKFVSDLGYQFTATNNSIIQELIDRKHELIDSWKNPMKETISCLICGNNHLMEMIDLGQQPEANQFTVDTTDRPKFPLAMYRCINCDHNQLNYIVPPEELFSDYVYVTGTSQTMVDYSNKFCEDFCNKSGIVNGNVLDIACNDGTQLNPFRSKGWRTYGVDPAKNLEPIATANGHSIIVGFWGDSVVTSKLLEIEKEFDLIIAQNVFAHVPNPREFLMACREIMSGKTTLLIQTSQAKIFQNGEFDTIYHEHLSFFTVKSMLNLCSLCNLQLEDVFETPVHGTSYVFVISKNVVDVVPLKVLDAIEREKVIYDPINPIVYRSHALEKKDYICDMLSRCKYHGYKIIGFGASAKGSTLLNFIHGSAPSIPLPEYIIDENSFKQNKFTPGTKIPVVDVSSLEKETGSIAILVTAWNFLEEIKSKVMAARKNMNEVNTLLLVPFPNPAVMLLRNGSFITMSEFKLSMTVPPSPICKTLLITHFYNEEILLPYWIMHHAPMFDEAVLIDYDSTDRSLEIIRKLAPSNWKVIKSRNRTFDAVECDMEVRDIERSFADDIWKVALTVTEFIVWPNMKIDLANTHRNINCYKIHHLVIVGDDDVPLNPDLPLVEQRCAYGESSHYDRFIHRNHNSTEVMYTGPGRHYNAILAVPAYNAILFKYLYSPWPESIGRKLQIGPRQSERDILSKLGEEHQVNRERLEALHKMALEKAGPDLLENGADACNYHLLRSKILHEVLSLPWSTTAR